MPPGIVIHPQAAAFGDQAALAQPGFSGDENDPPTVIANLRKRLLQQGEFVCPADQRGVQPCDATQLARGASGR